MNRSRRIKTYFSVGSSLNVSFFVLPASATDAVMVGVRRPSVRERDPSVTSGIDKELPPQAADNLLESIQLGQGHGKVKCLMQFFSCSYFPV